MKNGGRIADIEVLRGIAISMVLFEHINFLLFYWHSRIQDFNQGYWRGGTGVNLFFTISGFVIAVSLLPRLQACSSGSEFTAEVKHFLVRRFWRLQPAAWVWLLVPLFLCIIYNRSGAFLNSADNFSSGLAAIMCVANLRSAALGVGASPGISFHYWSLSLEEQFYILLPFVIYLARGRLTSVLLILFTVQFLFPGALQPGALAVGVLLACWRQHPAYHLAKPRFLARGSIIKAFFLVSLLGLLGMCLSDLRRPLSGPLMYTVCSVLTGILVYTASFDCGYIISNSFLKRVLIWLGSRSYSVYLAHVCAYAGARETMFRLHPLTAPPGTAEAAAYILLAVFLTLAGAELSYKLIECPGREFGRLLAPR